MNFLCPACKTPLPVATPAVVACTQCGVEVDLTRVDTAPGQARLWPEVDLTGEKLGSFKLNKRAGSGGMGTVYVAQRLRAPASVDAPTAVPSGRPDEQREAAQEEGLAGRCAVKVLSAQMAADPGLRERFRREAQALRAVQHPGVVHIIDEGQENGFCWYAMEHVDGKDLRARIAEGPLPLLEVEKLARDLLDALAAVHDAQLVHRDLKPGNILLAPNGARLCDFGIARFDGATTLTESAALLGSLRYMAPEQRAGVTTPKSDLYSLGLVLYEAATGGLPGERDAPGGRLGRLIDTLLQPSPAKRPADARAAAKLIAPRSYKRVGTAALVASSVLGVSAFATWVVTAMQFTPRTTAVAVKDAPRIVFDAGETIVASPPKLPRVRIAKPEVKGLNALEMTKLAEAHQGQIQNCYEDALTGKPDLAGRLVVRVNVDNPAVKGRTPALLRPMLLGAGTKKKPSKAPPDLIPPLEPIRTTLEESTLDDRGLEACVLEKLRTWVFGPGRGVAVFTWTFDTATQEQIFADLKTEADSRAAAGSGVIDPREPLPMLGTKGRGIGLSDLPTKSPPKPNPKPPPESKIMLATKEPPASEPAVDHYRLALEQIAEIQKEVKAGTRTEEEGRKASIAAVDDHIAQLGRPTSKDQALQLKSLESVALKLAAGK